MAGKYFVVVLPPEGSIIDHIENQGKESSRFTRRTSLDEWSEMSINEVGYNKYNRIYVTIFKSCPFCTIKKKLIKNVLNYTFKRY